MLTTVKTVTELPAWKTLSAHSQKVGRLHLRKIFAQQQLTMESNGKYINSKARKSHARPVPFSLANRAPMPSIPSISLSYQETKVDPL